MVVPVSIHDPGLCRCRSSGIGSRPDRFWEIGQATSIDDYSYQQHMDWMQSFIDKLDLKDITLVCQDWGSLLGLRLAAENPDRFRAIVVGNGMLPTGDQKAPSAFKIWKNFALHSPWFPIGRIINTGSFRKLGPDELRAYDAPFPGKKYKAGARAFPRLVPMTPNDPATEANRAAWKVLERWDKPFLTTFSNGDPITRGGDRYMQDRIPGPRASPMSLSRVVTSCRKTPPCPLRRRSTACWQASPEPGSVLACRHPWPVVPGRPAVQTQRHPDDYETGQLHLAQ